MLIELGNRRVETEHAGQQGYRTAWLSARDHELRPGDEANIGGAGLDCGTDCRVVGCQGHLENRIAPGGGLETLEDRL